MIYSFEKIPESGEIASLNSGIQKKPDLSTGLSFI
jgi:hypothetical protein